MAFGATASIEALAELEPLRLFTQPCVIRRGNASSIVMVVSAASFKFKEIYWGNPSFRKATETEGKVLKSTSVTENAGWRKEGTLKLLSNQWRVLAIVGLVAASLTSAPRRALFSARKAPFYADAQTVEFVLVGADHYRELRRYRLRQRHDYGYLFADRSQWFAFGFGWSDHAWHNQPELRCRSDCQGARKNTPRTRSVARREACSVQSSSRARIQGARSRRLGRDSTHIRSTRWRLRYSTRPQPYTIGVC